MDWHKYQKLLYWKDFVMNCFCFQIFCDHLIVMRYFVMGDHVMAINVPLYMVDTRHGNMVTVMVVDVFVKHWRMFVVSSKWVVGSVSPGEVFMLTLTTLHKHTAARDAGG